MITLKTILLFLIGQRNAIEKIANGKHCLLLGVLFLIIAGLAKYYDQRSLLLHPLSIGFILSINFFLSLFIYAFIKYSGGPNRKKITGKNYTAFLKCYVITAPLTWLHATPIEQFADTVVVTKVNFIIFLIVSLWRALLMIRVTQVIFKFSLGRALTLMAMPASIEIFVITAYSTIDLKEIQTNPLSPANQFLLSANQTIAITSIICFVISIVAYATSKGHLTSRNHLSSKAEISKPLWLLSSIMAGVCLIPSYQPQRKLRNLTQLRSHLSSYHYQAALNFLKDKNRADFPTHQPIISIQSSSESSYSALDLLANCNQWPGWLHDEFINDVQKRIKWEEGLKPEKLYEKLYQNHRESPFIQEVADQITPRVKASDYFLVIESIE